MYIFSFYKLARNTVGNGSLYVAVNDEIVVNGLSIIYLSVTYSGDSFNSSDVVHNNAKFSIEFSQK